MTELKKGNHVRLVSHRVNGVTQWFPISGTWSDTGENTHFVFKDRLLEVGEVSNWLIKIVPYSHWFPAEYFTLVSEKIVHEEKFKNRMEDLFSEKD